MCVCVCVCEWIMISVHHTLSVPNAPWHPHIHTDLFISTRETERESIVGFSRENWGSIVGLNRRCSDPWEFFNPHTKWLSLAYEREGGRVSLWTVYKDPSPPPHPSLNTGLLALTWLCMGMCPLSIHTTVFVHYSVSSPQQQNCPSFSLSVCRRWRLNMFCFVRGQSVTHKGLLFARNIWLLGE